MPTTPINGLRFPALSDNANVPLYITNLATDVDSRLVARFANAAARDAITPTAGMLAHTANDKRLWQWTGSLWALIAGPVPHFTGTLSANAAIPSGSWTVVGISAESVDTDNEHDHTAAWPTSAYYTAAIPGWRRAVGTAAFFPNGTGARGVRLLRTPSGGAAAAVSRSASLVPATGGTVSTVVSTPSLRVFLNAGDRLYMEAYQSSGADLNALGGTTDQATGLEVTFDGSV